ncbi:MAG: type I-B CRISPR-associated endonuclease Cas1b [Candidatus Micrarchaeia archaeon]
MAKSIYINKNSIMKRKNDTIYIIYKTESGKLERKIIPINQVYDIYAHGTISMSSGSILMLGKLGIPVHFFDFYGFYRSSLIPKRTLLSGSVIIKQAEHFINREKRLNIAKEIIKSASYNMLKNLYYYNRDSEHIKIVEDLRNSIDNVDSVTELMGIEGNIRNLYYKYLDEVLPDKFKIVKREKKPPSNFMNSLISFGNSLMYASTITEIYNTHLDQTISFLHEPSERRFSLSLDISELFKPIIIDRIIMGLINRNMIDESYFDMRLNGVLLNEKGRRLFIEEYENKMSSTLKYKKLNKIVSLRHLIRLECYKIEKHILGIDNYKGFKVWW